MNRIRLKAGLPDLPVDLLLARDRGEVLFIVGAGASYPAPSNLPGFEGLVADIYAEVDSTMVDPIRQVLKGVPWADVPNTLNDNQRTELKFFQSGEFDVVLGMLERRIDGDPDGTSTMRAAANTVLGRTREPNRLHRALTTLAQRYGQTTLVTTNFDRLLSVAAAGLKLSSTGFSTGQIPRPSRSAEFGGIVHVHGMFPYGKEPGSPLILTDQDFGDNYLRRQTITSFLYDAARIFRLVLVGYSANDSPVRYLLNAIAADVRHFSDLKERYAFVSTRAGDTRTSAEWQARGITPIPYDDANGHQALGDVLVEWANAIPTTANAHNLKKRLKYIAGLRRESSEGTLAIPVLEYLVRRSTPTERRELARTLSDAGAHPEWLTEVNRIVREHGGDLMRGLRATDREVAVASISITFLRDRLEERTTLEWAASLGQQHMTEQTAIREMFDRKELVVAEPYLSAWRRIFHFWARPNQTSGYDRLLLRRELKPMASPREAVALIVECVRPWLKVTVRGRLEALYGLKVPKRPRYVRDLLSVTFFSGEPISPEEMGLPTIGDDDFLEELARSLDAALFSALVLAREIGAVTANTDETLWQLHRSYFVPPSQWPEGGNEPDRFGRGFSNCVKLLHAVIERLAVVKPAAAVRLTEALARNDWNIYRRLWAALARDAALVSEDQVESFLIALPDAPFWMIGQFPEIAELRALRWPALSAGGRRAIEARLRKGTPAALRPKRLLANERSDYSRRHASAELQRIKVAGGQVSTSAEKIISDVASLEHAPSVKSVTHGFNGGVTILSSAPGSAARFQIATEETLLQMVRENDDSDDGDASSYVGSDPQLATDLLRRLRDDEEAVAARIWRAIGYNHRPLDRNTTLNKADAETLGTIGPANEVLKLIANLAPDMINKEVEALTSWMDAWKHLLHGEGEYFPVWFRLWPAAVGHVNGSVERDDALINRAYGSPVGNLVSASVSAMPSISAAGTSLFAEAPLRGVLQRFADSDGEARLQVQYRLISSLAYLHLAEPQWTLANLVEPLRDASGGSMSLWGAFADAYLPHAEIMSILGPALAAAAVDHTNISPEVRGRLARKVMWSQVLPRLPKPMSAPVDLNSTQQMLRMGDDIVRAGAVEALKDVLKDKALGMDLDARFALVRSIFQEAWPRERTLNSPTVSEALADLPAASGNHFEAATEMIFPYLVPFDCWSLYDYGIWRTSDPGHSIYGIETARQAEALLTLMDRTIGNQEGAIIPNGLDQALEHIRSLQGALETDGRYQRLSTLTRR